jgi:hypothetical protein
MVAMAGLVTAAGNYKDSAIQHDQKVHQDTWSGHILVVFERV